MFVLETGMASEGTAGERRPSSALASVTTRRQISPGRELKNAFYIKNVVILLAGDTALANTTAGNVGVDGALSVSAEGDAAAKSLPTEQKGLGFLIITTRRRTRPSPRRGTP